VNKDELKEAAVSYRAVQKRSEFAPLIDELYREEVLDARLMSPEEKFLLGEELFNYACSITLEGIRNQNPGYTREDCLRELKRRLELRERMERPA
jgi:hypothetical protein